MLSFFNKNVLKVPQLERICKDYFGVDLGITNIVLNYIPTSKNSHTTVFKADRHTVYALCVSDDPLVLADIKSIIKLMGMKAEEFLPPDADTNYFLRFGHEKFLSAYPGRKSCADDETTFYQTLAPYNTALVRISKINGEIRQYDDTWKQWQKALEFSYLRMQVR